MRPILFVASTGGHLAQLHRLRPRLRQLEGPDLWVTFDAPQSRSLLAGENVRYVRYTASRDIRSVVANLRSAVSLLRGVRPRAVVSTGSGIALSFLPAARLLGIPVLYIESAARSNGPSLTGRLISRLPGVGLLAQYPAWAGERWRFAGSVFDEFAPAEAAPPRGRPLRAVVTLGTIPFPFGRAVEQLLDLLPEDAEVVWQTGHTDAPALGEEARAAVPAAELHQAFRWADLVVAHSGVGSALDALDAGRHPVLLHRDPAHGEHIDDHQVLVASELERRGLATSRRVEDLSRDDLVQATSRGTKHLESPPPIEVPPEIARLAAPA